MVDANHPRPVWVEPYIIIPFKVTGHSFYLLLPSVSLRAAIYAHNEHTFHDVATKHLVGCIVLTKYVCNN